ncbi:hypothetical protein [Staphylococcus ureilyticus]|uniref:hypothetical protein n=2 Tax=Staphylococcus TaxID=1279 RepID=UPI00387B0473
MFLTLFLVLMSLAIFLAVIHTLFGDFDFIFVILASLYFKFGTDKGRISDN